MGSNFETGNLFEIVGGDSETGVKFPSENTLDQPQASDSDTAGEDDGYHKKEFSYDEPYESLGFID